MARLVPKPSVIKKLFSLSGNRCAFPDCKNENVIEGIVVGKVAHICAAEIEGPRYDVNMTDEERRSFENQLVLCPTHHDVIDKMHEKYSVAFLKNVKQKHEERYSQNQYIVPDDVTDSVIDELNISQQNVLHSGVQNNYQQIQVAATSMQDFLGSISNDISATAENDTDTDIGHYLTNEDSGLLEDIQKAVDTIPAWTQTIQEGADAIKRVAPIMDYGVARMSKSDKQGGGTQGRIRILNETAKNLLPIANSILDVGHRFDKQINIVDKGMSAIITLQSYDSGENDYRGFVESIGELSSSANQGLGALDELLKNMRPLERITHDMKKPISVMREGLELMRAGKPIINRWLHDIEANI